MSRRAGERIYYVVPEDGDDEGAPNYFFLPGPSGLEVKLNDIKHFFPLEGNYHFRFIQSIGGMRAWVDMSDDTSPVPRFEGAILFKATRLTTEDESRLGGLKSFLATMSSGQDAGSADESQQPVNKLKSYISKACTSAGLFSRDDEPAESPKPLRRAQSAAAVRPSSQRVGSSSSSGFGGGGDDDFSPTSRFSASAQRAAADRGVTSPQTTRQQPTRLANPRSSSSLADQASLTNNATQAASAQRTVKSASPPKFAATQPPPPANTSSPPAPPLPRRGLGQPQQQQQALPPQNVQPVAVQQQPPKAPASDLLGLDHSPLHHTQAQQSLHQQQQRGAPNKNDWHAFVGLEHAPAQQQPPRAPMNAPMNAPVDPFAMQQQQQQRPYGQQQPRPPVQVQQQQQQTQQQQNFNAFLNF
mmetsp:Transcript_11953/g.39323  ORF Transcript_11953/g.39323 Transcript_11953/m.39323 type:complete len:414 (-) Transcript_11953:130-1371(-)|eukprot:CAMPEP_0118902116 /NCGR_PEP_ID=MMETSP1166-20130328/7544_1 /TAXON_ID=1104430 /ORGANISM="Chrysoreinhardia sp, Strain CCMP3193" /LENGTH=413 /DNA_ID=CAMNT_0006841317 /DNA_START=29 /DNA_END=1270 /DNA_ORIENTATION=+